MTAQLYRVGEAARLLGFDPQTLRRWADTGEIVSFRIGKERRIPASEVRRLLGEMNLNGCLLYGRAYRNPTAVDEQMTKLREWARQTLTEEVKIIEIKDVGSGLDPQRKELISLFDLIQQRRIRQVVTLWRECLAQVIGFEYIETYCSSYGVEVVVLCPEEQMPPTFDELLGLMSKLKDKLSQADPEEASRLRQVLDGT